MNNPFRYFKSDISFLVIIFIQNEYFNGGKLYKATKCSHLHIYQYKVSVEEISFIISLK